MIYSDVCDGHGQPIRLSHAAKLHAHTFALSLSRMNFHSMNLYNYARCPCETTNRADRVLAFIKIELVEYRSVVFSGGDIDLYCDNFTLNINR